MHVREAPLSLLDLITATWRWHNPAASVSEHERRLKIDSLHGISPTSQRDRLAIRTVNTAKPLQTKLRDILEVYTHMGHGQGGLQSWPRACDARLMEYDPLAARQDCRNNSKSTMRLSIEMQQGDQARDLMVQVAHQSPWLLAAVNPIWYVYVSCVPKGIVRGAARYNGRHRGAEAYCTPRVLHCKL